MRWAYLSETDSSYAIERQTPSPSKAEAFANLLARAHDPEAITPAYLVALQNLTVSNPLDQAVAFRGHQNRLRNDLRGALGVTYLPPPPEQLPAVMEQVMGLCNDRESTVNPLVRGSLASFGFGFVFAHPFMDGNGRLSRFLFHKIVCGDPRLASGLVLLPISMAMKRHEAGYLAALQAFSKPARGLWDVTELADGEFEQHFRGAPEVYRFWDATACVEFGLGMAREALQHDLQQELQFLNRYDAIYQAVNDAVDMNNNDLVLLVRSIAQHGSLSRNRLKQLLAKGHPPDLLQSAQEAAAQAIDRLQDARLPSVADHPRPLARECLVPVGPRHRRRAPAAARAAAAARWMLQPRIVARALRLMPRPLVGGQRGAQAGVHVGDAGGRQPGPRRIAAAARAWLRLLALGNAAQRLEGAAVLAAVVVGRHAAAAFSGRATAASGCCRRCASPAPPRWG